MAIEVVMPKLGWTMEEGTMGKWLKADGDEVAVGEALFTVESDKATEDVVSMDEGVLRIPPGSPVESSVVPVGTVLAYIVESGEPAPFERSNDPTATQVDVKMTLPSDVLTPMPERYSEATSRRHRRHRPAISPRARRLANALGIDWMKIQGSGVTGRIVERDVRVAAAAADVSRADRLKITPVASRLAESLGVDLAAVADDVAARRIRRADVEQAVSREATRAAEPPMETREVIRQPITTLRRLIADRMAESAHTTAPVTLTTEVDATELVRIRKGLTAGATQLEEPVPTYNDMIAKIVAVALLEHPQLNSTITEDALMQHTSVHLGLAVATERGLLVPVIRDVHSKSLQGIARESAQLIERALSGKANKTELTGSTFTITNLGMFGIDSFTPIINLPECAILGLGRVTSKIVVVDEEAETTAIRKRLTLSLTFDHRVVDGMPAARFLQSVGRLIENPYLWMIR